MITGGCHPVRDRHRAPSGRCGVWSVRELPQRREGAQVAVVQEDFPIGWCGRPSEQVMHTGIQVGRCDLDQEIAAIDREPVAVFVERLGRDG